MAKYLCCAHFHPVKLRDKSEGCVTLSFKILHISPETISAFPEKKKKWLKKEYLMSLYG